MVELRPYQHEALVALFQYWRAGGGNPLVDFATGTGKSFLIGDLSRRMWLRQRRILIVSHVREIITQDLDALQAIWPDMPTRTLGINSAALGERNTQAPILLATVQSIFRNPQALGPRNLLIVDEAHRIPKSDTGMFHATIGGLRALYPRMRVAGFTATPYRLDSGRLDQGKTRLFDRVVHTYSIADAVRDGWLSPLVPKEQRARSTPPTLANAAANSFSASSSKPPIMPTWSRPRSQRSCIMVRAGEMAGSPSAAASTTPFTCATPCAIAA
jgi:DNA repair protein RadD